jgi:hypothetical protein
MNRSEILNGGAYCCTARATGNHTAVAAGSGDNTEVNCDWIDRMVGDNGRFEHAALAMSAKLAVGFTTTLAVGKTLSFAVQWQDADTIGGSGAADYGDNTTLTVAATGDTGGSTELGTFESDVGLEGARRFVRAQVTPDLNAGSVDTAAWSAIYALFGGHNVIITKSAPPVATP